MSGKHAAPPGRAAWSAGRRRPGAADAAWPAGQGSDNGSAAGNGGTSANAPGSSSAAGRGQARRPERGGQATDRRRAWAARAAMAGRAALTPAAAAGLGLLAVLVLFCYAGPLVYHSNLTRVNLLLGNRPPGPGHPLGTDGNGLDVLGLLMAGGRISLEVGAAAGLLAALIGSGWGALAGYVGGPVDALMMRIVDAGVAIPTLALLLLLSAIYTPSAGVLVVVIAATSWLSTAYLVRGTALTLRSREYVQAVRLMGGGRIRAVARHIAPNALGVITVNVSFQVADAILALATLSYLGLGVRPPSSDWGDMVAGGVRYIYDGYWWEIYPAGVALIVAVVAFNLLGDGLREGLTGPGRSR